MFRILRTISATAAVGIAASASAQHNHLTVDTGFTPEGAQVVIVAGYLPTESAFTVVDGRLLKNGEIAVYTLTDQLTQAGPLNAWYAGFEILLTSDFYFITGRLDGGNYMWELADVVRVSGRGPIPVGAWGTFQGIGQFVPAGLSDASTRTGRSYDSEIGSHEHDQGYAFNSPGLIDLTFIAWDSNGVYLDSEPVTVRFRVGCLADYNGDGFVDGIDYDTFNNDFEAGDLSADVNGDGFVDGIDYDTFNNHFESGC